MQDPHAFHNEHDVYTHLTDPEAEDGHEWTFEPGDDADYNVRDLLLIHRELHWQPHLLLVSLPTGVTLSAESLQALRIRLELAAMPRHARNKPAAPATAPSEVTP